MSTEEKIIKTCNEVQQLLLYKNKKYGDSAINPIRVVSKSSNIEQILVRIDDKLNRISQGNNLIHDDEDVVMDLIGYFILLKVAIDNDAEASYNVV